MRRRSPWVTFNPLSWRRRASDLPSTRNSTSKLGNRISSSILMASSVWHAARHLISGLLQPRGNPTHRRQTPIIRSSDVGLQEGLMMGESLSGTSRLSGSVFPTAAVRTRPLTAGLCAAACLTLLVSAAVFAVTLQAQRPTFRAGTDLVSLGATVTDRRANFVTDLTQDEIEIFEDGKKQT